MTIKTLKLHGRLDSAAASKLEPEFLESADAIPETHGKAIIDLHDLVYISSMGIRLLITTIKRLKRKGIAFATVRPHDETANELLITVDLMQHLNAVKSAEEAHHKLKPLL